MDHVEAEGETIDEAIENALKTLGLERDRITVEIIAEGRKGVFGIGSQRARVRASLRKAVVLEEEGETGKQRLPDRITEERVAALGEKGKEVLAEILRLMGVHATIEIKPGETHEEVILNIHGENGGLLIGRRGQTLEALQYLLTRVVGERHGMEGPQLVVDTENYRGRRKKTLEDMALRLGEKAKRKRKTVSIDFLSARDRRIIHITLEDDPWLITKSLGKGAYRRLLIIPEGDRKKKEQEKGATSGRQASKGQR
ncbi:MAG: RNA-binding cell elongation regulator Jag/EloR [Candidatus Binatia bacterium]